MYNGKPVITTALTSDSSLIALIPAARINDSYPTESTPIYPFLSFMEIGNTPSLNADDEEIESEVTFRIDIYGKSSLSVTAGHVDRIMKSIGYGRNYSDDNNEMLDDGTKIFHKVMSFTGTFTYTA